MNRCIVEGCTTGLLNKTNRKQAVITKQNLLFQVPNEPNLLNKCRTALGQNIQPGDKVCEFHFGQNNVLQKLSTFSQVKSYNSSIFTLKLSAIPNSSMVEKDPLEIQKPNNQQNKVAGYILEDDTQSHDSDDSVVVLINGEEERENFKKAKVIPDTSCKTNAIKRNVTLSSQSNNKQYQNQSKGDATPQNKYEQAGEQHIIRIAYNNNSQQSESKKQSTKEKIVANYVKNGVVIKRVIQSSQPNSVNNQTQKICQKRKLNNPSPAINKLSQSDTNNSSRAINKLSKPDVNKSPCEPCIPAAGVKRTRFSFSPATPLDNIDQLKLILRQRCIRPQWCVKIEEKSVFFSYIDFEKSRVNCCLEIAEDFTVNAYTADKVIAIYVTTTDGVRCIKEIIEVMKVLEKKRWCLGPGVPLVNRSPDCIGAMPVKTVSESCTACIKEKLNALTHTRELANCKVKLEESRHKCELMRKKHHYATSQYERLKSENKILEYQVDEAKKVAINDVLNRLPPLQKQVVRYIINGSYTSTSSLHYSTSWINHCIVMRNKSPAVYEYMRQHEILPLPCPDTLKKHKFKIILNKDPGASDSGDSIDYSKLPESPEMSNSLNIPESLDMDESLEMSESKEMLETVKLPESTIITESTEIIDMPELDDTEISVSTHADGYTTILELVPECIVSEDVAYEVTVSTEAVEE